MQDIIMAGLNMMRIALFIYTGAVIWNLFLSTDKQKALLGPKNLGIGWGIYIIMYLLAKSYL
jgi:hypothetical protein